MRSKSIGSVFVGLALVAAIVAITPSAFADHTKLEVNISAGSSTPGCETSNSCFDPHEAIMDLGGEVTWNNADTAAHTVTSGNPTDGPDGAFDSSLFGPGKTFSHKFETAGTFNYFCMVHPWMAGIVTVEEAGSGDGGDGHDGGEETYVTGMVGDVTVKVGAAKPATGEELTLDVSFERDGTPIEHVNYDITATQDGTEVLSASGEHSHTGEAMHTTDALGSDSPVDVQVTVLGIGLPDEEANWTEPKGEMVTLQVVPEFGTIAALVLAISIVSIVAITAKTRVIPKL